MSIKNDRKNRPRLGRGLSSLISIPEPVVVEIPPTPAAPVLSVGNSSGTSPANAQPPRLPEPPTLDSELRSLPGQPVEIPIAAIVPNPHQPRQVFNDASLADLAASIRSSGLIQPVLVRQTGQEYQLIAGERRLRAAKLAGLEQIPAIVREVDAVTQAQMALIENIQREDLNPIDRAQGYRTLIDQLGLTQAELAGRLGEDRSSIANHLRLLDLAESVRAMVKDGRLSLGHAKLIAGVSDILEQQRLANLVLLQGLSVRNLERLMAAGPKTQAEPPAKSASPHIIDLEKSLARQLGLRVQVRSGKKGRGKLILHYGSLDQFDQLLERLGVVTE